MASPHPRDPALKVGNWVRIINASHSMVSARFVNGTPVRIRKVQDAATTPRKQGWTMSLGDSVYGIERKISEPNMVSYTIPWQSAVSHLKVSLTVGGSPTNTVHQPGSRVYLLEGFAYPKGPHTIRVNAGTWITIAGSPISRRTGANTGQLREAKNWFYIGVYEVQEGVRTRLDPYLLTVEPERLGTTLIEEPKE